jgi:hypothetical protein
MGFKIIMVAINTTTMNVFMGKKKHGEIQITKKIVII